MRLILGIIAFAAAGFMFWLGTVLSMVLMGHNDPEPIHFVIGIVTSLVTFSLIMKSQPIVTGIISETASSIKSVGEDISSRMDSGKAEYLAVAEKEVDEGHVDSATWSQALVKAKGDESQRKVEYMKLRAKQLKKI